MREILFRGKRSDNGEWVEGGYKHEKVGEYFTAVFIIEQLTSGVWENNRVDPATVGQFTGMVDKNGKRIFEGDVVKFYERQLGGEDVPIYECVEFSEGGFCTHRYFLNNWLRNAVNGNIQLEDIEVIGNIHDNSELLEGGAKGER